MVEGLVLRPAIAADAQDLTAIIVAAYAPYRAAGVDLPPVAEGIDRDIADKTVWVATLDQKMLGGMVMTLTPQAHLMNIAVSPAAAGKGVGAALLAKAEALAIAADHSAIHLATHSAMTATQAFYRAKGWVDVGREGDKLMMAKDLRNA